MNISRKLIINGPRGKRIISFGETTTKAEQEEAFRFRYKVYLERDYIDPDKYPNQSESDEYDSLGKSHHFIAVLEEDGQKKMIGYIRLIIDDPLPTEIDFEFNEPLELKLIPRNQRAELGRFIIVPPNREQGDFLPRGMTMLFLLNVLSEYGIQHNLLGGYAFIKESLNAKLSKARFPVGYIEKYKQRYPKEGVLYKYFTQSDDPVVPIFFITQQFFNHTEKMIHNPHMFEVDKDTCKYRNNAYTWFLKTIKIT